MNTGQIMLLSFVANACAFVYMAWAQSFPYGDQATAHKRVSPILFFITFFWLVWRTYLILE